MILPPFELHRPRTIDEAVTPWPASVTSAMWPAARPPAELKQRLNAKPHLVSLEHIPELRLLTPERIGAMARLGDIARHPGIRSELPVVADTAAQVASPLLIEQATIGGNLLLDTRCFYFNQSLFWRESKWYCLKAVRMSWRLLANSLLGTDVVEEL
jgi:4-hydroxybenzoyl-CoA reductase subunit beta